jgi:hypothetical protein
MKLMKIARACAALVGGIALSSAAASYAHGPAGSLFSKETAVLAKKGVSPARASRALDVQGKVASAGLVSDVQAAIGSAYAGAWFDPATALLHFGVTSDASRQAAQQVVAQTGLASVVTFTPVRSTWAALAAVQEKWGQRLGELFGGQGTTTALDARRNAVFVTLSASTPPEERAELERDAAVASVNVLVRTGPPVRLESAAAFCKFIKTLEAYCETTLVSGVGIAPGSLEPLCTAGPLLIEAKETYMLTAGHCFTGTLEQEGVIKEKVTSAYPEAKPKQKEIGKEGSWVYTLSRDMAEVKISAGSAFRNEFPTPVPALLAEWGKKTTSPQAVISDAANVEGETNCHEGMTSGEQCGTIEKTNAEVEDINKNKFKHLVKDSACAEGGDSGGPFLFSESKINNVHMQGMLVKAVLSKKCSESGEQSFYYALKEEGVKGTGIYAAFPGQALLTKANETRK